MKYLKLFDNHSGYTEYMSGEAILPNVSHCVLENEVHYNPELPSVLPGNEEAWEAYCGYICNDDKLETDLRNIFSRYPVTMSQYNRNTGSMQEPDTEYGVMFRYNDSDTTWTLRVVTSISYRSGNIDGGTENDCGYTLISYGIWNDKSDIGPGFS